MVLAAPRQLLVDFGLRRAHGGEAGLLAARACYLAGFAGTATLLAEPHSTSPPTGPWRIPSSQVLDDETTAFETFAPSRPDNLILLIDTYNSEAAARKLVELAPRLAGRGIAIRGVRLDSGDLAELSRSVRSILDQGGLGHVQIFASGGLDEESDRRTVAAGAPITDSASTRLDTSSDVPALDLRLQAASLCRHRTPKKIHRQGDLARREASFSAARYGGTYGRGRGVG